MKNISTAVKQRIIKGEHVYTAAVVYFPDNTRIYLSPEKFRVTGNSYTTNGGNTFPIGKVLSKSVVLKLSNLHNEWDAYDWRKARIDLRSHIYDSEGTLTSMQEGRFYAASVRYVQSAIEVTAFDMLAQLDYNFVIRNVNSATGAKLYNTIWDYFAYLCDTVVAEYMGITLASGQHLYSDTLRDRHFNNSGFIMNAIQPDSRSKTTLRDVLGYIAQIAGGNIVMDNTLPTLPKIDIVVYNFTREYNYYNAMSFDDEVEDVYDAGDFTEPVLSTVDRYQSGTFSEMNYFLLDRYTTPPELEYSDTTFTGVDLTYPVVNDDDFTVTSATSRENVLALYNPLCEVASNTASEQTRLTAVAQGIANRFCNKAIRPFEGSFLCNPLIEFGDNVLVVDAFGQVYDSFVSEHTLNYLGTSEISNNTKSDNRSNQVYYK